MKVKIDEENESWLQDRKSKQAHSYEPVADESHKGQTYDASDSTEKNL